MARNGGAQNRKERPESGFVAQPAELLVISIVWILTRAFMIAQLGFGRGGKIHYADVGIFHVWSDQIARGTLPTDDGWQYPPGAAILFLLPRVFPQFEVGFVALVLVFDIIATVALIAIGRSERSHAGVWLWVLTLPVLSTLPLLRYDVFPTAIALVAFAVSAGEKVRDRLFGIVVGMGIAIKAWPVLVLLSAPSFRRGWTALTAAAATFLLITAVTWAALGNTLGFLSRHAGRGLEIEAVAATPWYILQVVFGRGVKWIARNGCGEIDSPVADIIASILIVAMVLLGFALALWWLAWQLSSAPKTAAVGRDATFTALLLYVVVSEVLSPQYLIWLIGLGAAAIASPTCRVRRPVLAVVVAVILTAALLASFGDLVTGKPYGAYILTLRNIVLLAAAVDAAIIMVRLVLPLRFASPSDLLAAMRKAPAS